MKLEIIEPESPTTRDEIRRELETLANRKAGLTPRSVVDVAKNKNSTLHRFFIWDDTEAARRFRLIQAYQLIRSVTVTIQASENKTVQVRAFVNVKPVASDGTINMGDRGQFMPIADAMEDDDSRGQVIAAATRELTSFRRKYSALTELSEVIGAIDRLTLKF
jgi:hypothetical protein